MLLSDLLVVLVCLDLQVFLLNQLDRVALEDQLYHYFLEYQEARLSPCYHGDPIIKIHKTVEVLITVIYSVS